MKGGKLLAEGGYGCVFLPGINCDGSSLTSKKYVSKIQIYNKSAKNEIQIGKIVQTIGGFSNHFSPVYKHCSIKIATIKDEDIYKCTIIKKKPPKTILISEIKLRDTNNQKKSTCGGLHDSYTSKISHHFY